MAVAFFDLDRTLLSVNSGALWVRAELRDGRISRWQATRAAVWLFGYHLGYTRMEALLGEAIGTLAEQTEAEVRERTRAFYAREVRDTYRPGARAVVEAHRARGDTLALLTTSSLYLSEVVLEELGFAHALCNRFEVVDGRFTGRAQGELCFGAGKLSHARALCDTLSESLDDASFYTDSHSDLAMLEAVGNPVVVHPDPRLKRMAVQRGWTIADWSAPERVAEPGGLAASGPAEDDKDHSS